MPANSMDELKPGHDAFDVLFTPSDFVVVVNQTFEYAYPRVVIEGEIANFKVSKGRWVYFDLKDEQASVKFFGTVFALPGPLEDGMMVRVSGQPKLSPMYGFSVSFQSILPIGEGTIAKASQLLENKLRLEGLFDDLRKRELPYTPSKIGLITSAESAAYKDFMKVLGARWGGVEIEFVDVQVQGELAVDQIVRAFKLFGESDVDVVVLTRGGGSADDLAVFSTEQVTRSVAGCRVPTLVAIGHERDVCLAELAADVRASTPSNAAEILTPDRKLELANNADLRTRLDVIFRQNIDNQHGALADVREQLQALIDRRLEGEAQSLDQVSRLLELLNPNTILSRGYAVVYGELGIVKSIKSVSPGDNLRLQLNDGFVDVEVQ